MSLRKTGEVTTYFRSTRFIIRAGLVSCKLSVIVSGESRVTVRTTGAFFMDINKLPTREVDQNKVLLK